MRTSIKAVFRSLFLFSPLLILGQETSPGNRLTLTKDGEWQNVGSPGFSTGWATSVSLAISPAGEPWVAFTDYFYSMKVSVMKYQSQQWSFAGNPGMSTGYSYENCLAFSPAGVPFLAYMEEGYYYGVWGMKYDGGNWIGLDDLGHNTKNAYTPSLAFHPGSEEPCLAYRDGYCTQLNGQVTVRRWKDNRWDYEGNSCFGAYSVSAASLACSPSGVMHVAYVKENGPASVMKLDSAGWNYLGLPDFTGGKAFNVKLALSPLGIPYALFRDEFHGEKLSVMSFPDSIWKYVGSPGFSEGVVTEYDIAISPAGQVFVAFRDAAHDSRVSVMRYDGSQWVYVGSPGFTPGVAYQPSIAVNANGEILVAFSDLPNNGASVMKHASIPIGLESLPDQQIKIYPNPCSSFITVDAGEFNNQAKDIRVVDLTGRTIYSMKTNDHKINLDVRNFPVGIYLIKIITQGSVFTQKFCKK